ncbi:MAG TPA: P-loop NTPase [Gaiellaceae bacterium]|nr:P-loop NTPase [Gaiellaceae bacterium]
MTDDTFDPAPDGVSTLRLYLQALVRRWPLLVAPLLAIPLVTFVATKAQHEVFEASASVLVNRQEAATTTLIGQTPALDNPDRTMATQVSLARSNTVVDRVRTAADPPLPRTVFVARSKVFPSADILVFTFSDGSRERAARLAAAYAREYVRYRRALDTAALGQTLAELRGQLAQLARRGRGSSALYTRLADRAEQLEALAALRRSNVTLVQTTSPGDAEQVAPRPLRNTALALAAGLVVGLVSVFLAELLGTKPRSVAELESLLGTRYLGRIRLGGRDALPLVTDPQGAEADAVYALQASLELANRPVGARTVMVTSAHAGEGKSAVCVNLAVALARSGRHVALVDLDLRHPEVARLLGLDDRIGVTSVAHGACGLVEALVAVPLADLEREAASSRSNGRAELGGVLEVVTSGPLPAHPARLLGSKGLAEALAALAQRAEIVLVDVPPVLDAPDAAAVSARLDALLLVVDARRARGPVLAEVRRAVSGWPPRPLGFALVDQKPTRALARPLARPPLRARGATAPAASELERVP